MPDNTQDNRPSEEPPGDKPPENKNSKSKPEPKRLGTLATMIFIGLSGLFGGFIAGERYPPPQPLPSRPTMTFVDSRRETRNLADSLRHTLKMAADRDITEDEAVDQIADSLGVRPSNTSMAEQIRRIVRGVIGLATNDSVQEGLDAVIKLLEQMSKPSPSPKPTSTIVFPQNK